MDDDKPIQHLWNITWPTLATSDYNLDTHRWERWKDRARGIPLDAIKPPLPDYATVTDVGSWM